MSERHRQASLAAMLQRAGWRRDAALAALASATRATAAADATVRAIEAMRDRALGANRVGVASTVDPGSMLRGVARLAALDGLRALASARLDEAAALAARRRDESRAAQSRLDALERRRADDLRTARDTAERRAADETDRHWLATHRPSDPERPTP